MNYQPYDYESETDAAPWTAAAPSAQIVPPPLWNTAPASNQMLAAPPNTQMMPAPAPANSELLMLGAMLQSVQASQNQQMLYLREFDRRINHLEAAARPRPQNTTPSFERATWWAIWGLLMLVLGGALAVVIVLILLNIQFR